MSYVGKCKSGIGRVVGEIRGKLMIELVDENYEPIIKNGKPLSILVDKSRFKVIGVVCDGTTTDLSEADLALQVDPTIETTDNIEFNINNPEDETANGDSN
jgi:hypothetical protein